MIWKQVIGSIAQAMKSTLMAKKDYFRWQMSTGSFEYDGPTALFHRNPVHQESRLQ